MPKNHLRLVVSNDEMAVLEVTKEQRFLSDIRNNAFLCFVWDDVTEQVRCFTKGSEDEIRFLLDVAKEEVNDAD